MSKPITAILIGAGQRGALSYAPYALKHPDQLKFVAVAEPDESRRTFFADQHQLAPENVFATWEPLLGQPQLADAALICTQDQHHTGPAVAAMRAGYHVLLEKPMATTPEECRQLVTISQQYGRQLHICHVLRYTRHYQTLRGILQSGVLGQIVNISHRENVSWWHMAHSYVRGNWAKTAGSSPMILAKCCHDFDILIWLLERRCLSLASTGGLTHYRPENAPEGAPQFCLDGCPAAETCPYYAPFIYVDLLPFWRNFAATARGLRAAVVNTHLQAPGLVSAMAAAAPPLRQITEYNGWPRSVVTSDPTPENLMEALRQGPYGRCVYRAGNDVVDHQVVAMEFEGGLSVSLVMHGHSHLEGRSTRMEGSHGSLHSFFGTGGSWIEVSEHRSGESWRYDTSAGISDGHGGGDSALMAAFVSSLQGDPDAARTTAAQALESHLMAFAAEQARLEKRWIDREEFSH